MLLSIFTLLVCQSTYQHIFSDTYVQKFSLQCFMSTSYGGLTINFSTCFFWYIYVFFFRTTLCIVWNIRVAMIYRYSLESVKGGEAIGI